MEDKKEFNVKVLLKKKWIQVLLIVILICIVVRVIDILKNSYIDEEKVYNYQQQISSYLQEKYKEEFEICFFRKGYKKKIFDTGAGSIVYYGSNRDITEYVYKFSPKNNDKIICYIVYWDEEKNGNSEISEIKDGDQISVDSNKVAIYSGYKNYAQMLEVEEILKKSLSDEYIVNYDRKEKSSYTYRNLELPISSYRSIEAKTYKRLNDIIKYDMNESSKLYNNLLQLSKDKNATITLYHKDYNIRFKKDKVDLFTVSDNECSKLKIEEFDNVEEMISYLNLLIKGEIKWLN